MALGDGGGAECAAFVGGDLVATGSADGFLEVWNGTSGDLETRLAFQARDELMMHDGAVFSVAVGGGAAAGLLASGDADGVVKVWRVENGEAVATFAAHAARAKALQSASAVAFAPSGQSVLVGHLDGTVRLLGLTSGGTLRSFSGHSSFINSVAYFGAHLALSGSSDGTVRVWDTRSTTVLRTVRLPAAQPGAPPSAVNSVCAIPDDPTRAVACTASPYIYVFATGDGSVITRLSHGRPVAAADFVGAAVDASGETLFALAADRALYAFDLATGEQRADPLKLAVAAGDAVGITCHPTKAGVVAVWSTDALLKVYEAVLV